MAFDELHTLTSCHHPEDGQQLCIPAPWLQVQTANAAKVAAQQESHELRLKMRETDGEFTSDGKR